VRFSAAAAAAAARALPLWTLSGAGAPPAGTPSAAAAAAGDALALSRALEFRDFKDAWAFMSGVALAAEAGAHHPEWSNVYNRVTLRLTTHDAGGLTQRDVDLARAVDDLASRLGGR